VIIFVALGSGQVQNVHAVEICVHFLCSDHGYYNPTEDFYLHYLFFFFFWHYWALNSGPNVARQAPNQCYSTSFSYNSISQVLSVSPS
jgi:hypothetical protein